MMIKYSRSPAPMKKTSAPPTILMPISFPCHPERSGGFACEAATQSKDPYKQISSRCEGPFLRIFQNCGLVQMQMPQQQSQTNQRERRPAKHHPQRPLAQILLHLLLRLPGNEKGLLVLAQHDHVPVM